MEKPRVYVQFEGCVVQPTPAEDTPETMPGVGNTGFVEIKGEPVPNVFMWFHRTYPMVDVWMYGETFGTPSGHSVAQFWLRSQVSQLPFVPQFAVSVSGTQPTAVRERGDIVISREVLEAAGGWAKITRTVLEQQIGRRLPDPAARPPERNLS